MIIRLVKMTFEEPKIDNFKLIFKKAQSKISKMQGCLKVDLHQDIHQPEIFFTISHWESEHDLENYRKSELFINTWKQVKPFFKEKAEAWSLS
ncbi:MAG: antibiotic biosynthesis monooxygenase [Oligoflexus sp.]|nr:antibiotic biosynthesis monooxygenase [Pseudopedobacter sp.]